MALRCLFRIASAVVCAAGLWACAPAGPDAASLDHAELQSGWTAWVAARDSLFASAESPLAPPDRATFTRLPYFPYDSAFALPAALVPALATDTVRFPTTTGELLPMVRAGQLVFEAGGTERRLVAYSPVDGAAGRLFVPFRDATSGRATYGGGRYLDLDLTPSGRYALDFNRAYHPYCVYSPAWTCPLPPAENTLALAIEAGERLSAPAGRPSG